MKSPIDINSPIIGHTTMGLFSSVSWDVKRILIKEEFKICVPYRFGYRGAGKNYLRSSIILNTNI